MRLKKLAAITISLSLIFNSQMVFAQNDSPTCNHGGDDVLQNEAENPDKDTEVLLDDESKNNDEIDINQPEISEEINTDNSDDTADDIIDNTEENTDKSHSEDVDILKGDIDMEDNTLTEDEDISQNIDDADFVLGQAAYTEGNEIFEEITGAKAEESYKVCYSPKFGQTEARKMLSMINDFRASNPWAYDDSGKKVTYSGLGALAYDYELEKVAMQRAAEIALAYAHTRPDGNNCWQTYKDLGYTYSFAGENIAAGYNASETASAVFKAWREDDEDYSGQGHRRNMINKNFKAVGFGHVEYNGCHFWVQNFSGADKSKGKTDPNDSTMVVYVSATKSNISAEKMTISKTAVKLDASKSEKLPTVKADIKFNKGWPSKRSELKTFEIVPKWNVSDTTIAKIEDGKITAIKDGSTKVIATAWGLSKDFTLTVGAEKLISSAEVENLETSYVFTGQRICPQIKVKFGGKELSEGTDYTLEYSNNTNVGTASIDIYGINSFSGKKTVKFKIEALDLKDEAKLNSALKLTLSDADTANGEYYYTGKQIKPAFSLSINGIELEEGIDYKVTYRNNVKAGDGKLKLKSSPYIQIQGLNNYKILGRYKYYFTILPVDISQNAKADDLYAPYTGTKVKIAPIIYVGSTLLKNKRDYVIEKPNGYTDPVDAGDYTIKVTGKGGYCGSLIIPLHVSDAKIPVSKLKITVKKTNFDVSAARTDTGIVPDEVIVKNGRDVLTEGKDYSLIYRNNKMCGTALVTISANQASGYVGKVTKQYKISGVRISKAKIYGMVTKFTYDNTRHKQNFTDDKKDGYTYLTYTDKAGVSKKLIYNTDFTVSYRYAKRQNAGTVTMTITGNPGSGYEGTLKKNFKVERVALNSDMISVNSISSCKYTGKQVNPRVVIYYVPTGGAPVKLVAGEDYICTYKNNINPSSANARKAPTITIKGKGNYSNSKTINFAIVDGK